MYKCDHERTVQSDIHFQEGIGIGSSAKTVAHVRESEYGSKVMRNWFIGSAISSRFGLHNPCALTEARTHESVSMMFRCNFEIVSDLLW